MRTIRESFQLVVQNTQTNILPHLQTVDPKITRVHFQFGHVMDIVNRLKELEQPQYLQYTKYPLIAVLEDFPQRDVVEGLSVITPKILILNFTKPEYTREQRDTENFIPILMPLADEFVRQLRSSGHFSTNYKKTGERINRPFWGKEELWGNAANIMKDALDGIELRGFELTIRQQTICSPAFIKNF
jgi:hypothetical protein